MPQQQNDTVEFVIEGIPPSLNHAYGITAKYGKVRRFPNKKLKEWRDLVEETVTPQRIANAETYGVEILFYFPIRTKQGTLRHKDTDNMLKYVIDPIIKKVETYSGEPIDDCQITEIHAYKCESDVEKTEISLYAMV